MTQRAAIWGYVPAACLVSIPLHGPHPAAPCASPPPLLLPTAAPVGPQLMPAIHQQLLQQPALPLGAPPQRLAAMPPQHAVSLPLAMAPAPAFGSMVPRPLSQQQHQMPSEQQQREAVTMRPLYAGPRPTHPVRGKGAASWLAETCTHLPTASPCTARPQLLSPACLSPSSWICSLLCTCCHRATHPSVSRPLTAWPRQHLASRRSPALTPPVLQRRLAHHCRRPSTA